MAIAAFIIELSECEQRLGAQNRGEYFVAISVAILWQFSKNYLHTWHFRGKNRGKLKEKVATK